RHETVFIFFQSSYPHINWRRPANSTREIFERMSTITRGWVFPVLLAARFHRSLMYNSADPLLTNLLFNAAIYILSSGCGIFVWKSNKSSLDFKFQSTGLNSG